MLTTTEPTPRLADLLTGEEVAQITGTIAPASISNNPYVVTVTVSDGTHSTTAPARLAGCRVGLPSTR